MVILIFNCINIIIEERGKFPAA